MRLEFQDVVKSGLARQVADRIRNAILEGQVKIDERLPTEEELAASFGVSRPTIREALKRLAAQNLIRSRRGPSGGNFVRRPDPEGVSSAFTASATLLVGMGAFEIDEMLAARQETEAICCRLACERRTEDDLARMRAEIDLQSDGSISDEEFCASDVRFHRAIVDAAGNGPLSLMMYPVVEAFVPITNMIVSQVRERGRVTEHHLRLVEAVEGRDADAALDCLVGLIVLLRESYAESVKLRDARVNAVRRPA